MKGLKKIGILFMALAMCFGCDGDRELDCEYFNDCDTGGGGGGNSEGDVTFWNDNNLVGQITVYFDGPSATITTNANPSSCNTAGCANFTREPGTYSYSAAATTGETWSGSTTVSSGGCLLVYLP